MRHFFGILFPLQLYLLPYNCITLTYLIWVDLVCNCVWTFSDCLVWIMANYITKMFKLLNENIKKDLSWRKTRSLYLGLCNLTRLVNEQISSVIGINLLLNIFLILNHLFFGLNRKQSMGEIWVSLAFQITRVLLLVIFVSRVQEEARKTLRILQHIPFQAWNRELDILITNIRNEYPTLTGCNLFTVNRSVLLSVSDSANLNLLYMKNCIFR